MSRQRRASGARRQAPATAALACDASPPDAPGSGGQGSPASLQVFRKVLYQRQAFPDDYTDEHFLADLILNLNVRRRSFWVVRCNTLARSLARCVHCTSRPRLTGALPQVVWDSLAITQQLSVVTVTALVFYAVRVGHLATGTLLAVNGPPLLREGLPLLSALGNTPPWWAFD
jgi:Phosphatidylinositol N-acetylglucosaminyltransferase